MKEIMNVNIISNYIETNNLTVKEFCKTCNISVSTFYRIMKGGDCSLLSLYRIAKTMKIKLHQLF